MARCASKNRNVQCPSSSIGDMRAIVNLALTEIVSSALHDAHTISLHDLLEDAGIGLQSHQGVCRFLESGFKFFASSAVGVPFTGLEF